MTPRSRWIYWHILSSEEQFTKPEFPGVYKTTMICLSEERCKHLVNSVLLCTHKHTHMHARMARIFQMFKTKYPRKKVLFFACRYLMESPMCVFERDCWENKPLSQKADSPPEMPIKVKGKEEKEGEQKGAPWKEKEKNVPRQLKCMRPRALWQGGCLQWGCGSPQRLSPSILGFPAPGSPEVWNQRPSALGYFSSSSKCLSNKLWKAVCNFTHSLPDGSLE